MKPLSFLPSSSVHQLFNLFNLTPYSSLQTAPLPELQLNFNFNLFQVPSIMPNPTRPEAVSTGSTESLHLPPSNLGTPSGSPPQSGAASPLGFHLASLPGSRPASPEGISTPGSSRPPSPLLKALNKLSMTSEKDGQDESSGDGKSGLGRRPSVNNGGSLSRKNSLKTPIPRRGSSPALAPFLAKYDQFTGNDSGREEKVCVIGSGSWGTALARLAAQNAGEREG